MRQGVLSTVLGVAAVAFVAAPLTSFAGGTHFRQGDLCGKVRAEGIFVREVPQPQVLSEEPTQGIDGWGQAVPEDRSKSVRMVA